MADERKKLRYQERMRNGLCVRCSDDTRATSGRLCARHRDMVNRLSRARYKRKLLNGWCVECAAGVPATNGDYCDKHYDKYKSRPSDHSKRLAKVEATGKCYRNGCESAPVPGSLYCGYHLEEIGEYREAREKRNREAGLCRCGRPVLNGVTKAGKPFVTCEPCRVSKILSDSRVAGAVRVRVRRSPVIASSRKRKPRPSRGTPPRTGVIN